MLLTLFSPHILSLHSFLSLSFLFSFSSYTFPSPQGVHLPLASLCDPLSSLPRDTKLIIFLIYPHREIFPLVDCRMYYFFFFHSSRKIWRIMCEISNKKISKPVVSCLYERGFRIRVSPFVYTSVRVCPHATREALCIWQVLGLPKGEHSSAGSLG